MNKKDLEKVQHVFGPLLWDYNLSAEDFYNILVGSKSRIGFWNQERALIRVLERLGWYDILDILGLDFLKKHLTADVIAKLRFPDQQRKYDIIRKILHGESLSFPGWNSETRQRARNAVLSNRWYSAESALF